MNNLAPSTQLVHVPNQAQIGRAILWGGLIAGLLDATDGVVAGAIRGQNPIQVLQFVGSGLLGKSSYEGGLLTAGVGMLVHFAISFVVAAIYVLAASRSTFLQRNAIPSGLAYGAGVYLAMTYIVLPMTPVGNTPFELPFFLNGVIGHALFVGVAISLASQKWLAKSN